MSPRHAVPGPRPTLRSIVLPREHGSWAFALEPVLLGLVAAPSAAGAGLAVAATALFLTRRPQQIAAKRDGRFLLAASVLLGLSILAIVGLGWAFLHAGLRCAVSLLAAVPAGLLFVWFDRRRAARQTIAELAGAAFFAAFPAAMAVAAANDWTLAGVLAGFALIRAATSILSIRTFLRRRRGQRTHPTLSASAVLAVCGGFLVFAWHSSSWVPALWTLLFATFAFWLLGPSPPAWTAKRLGIIQMVVGAAAMITTGISFR